MLSELHLRLSKFILWLLSKYCFAIWLQTSPSFIIIILVYGYFGDFIHENNFDVVRPLHKARFAEVYNLVHINNTIMEHFLLSIDNRIVHSTVTKYMLCKGITPRVKHNSLYWHGCLNGRVLPKSEFLNEIWNWGEK